MRENRKECDKEGNDKDREAPLFEWKWEAKDRELILLKYLARLLS